MRKGTEMGMRGIAVGLALVGGALYGYPAEEFVLVDDGRSACTIELTGDRQVDADIAFFTNGIVRMSGAEPLTRRLAASEKGEASAETDAAGRRVYENRIVFDVREADLFHEDDYAIEFPDERTMRIVGTDMSCRWALNRILEENGAVFCFPGKHGTHWPKRKSVSVPAKPVSGTAGMKLLRQLYAEDLDWERCLNGKTYRGNFQNHSMFAIFPKEKYGTPEWAEKIMPMRKGKRVVPPGPNWASGWQPCFASQESVDEAVRNICAFFEKDPTLKVFSLSVNDLEAYCECDACRELNGGSFDRRPRFGTGQNRDHSPSYYTWANKVAEGVTKRFPKAVFGCLAYCGTIDPPPFKLHPAIVPFLCQDLSKIGDEKEFAKRVDLIRAWQDKATALGFWDYGYGCRHYVIPRLYSDLQEKFFALKADYPCLQSYFCEGSSFIGEGPKRYLYYRYMWNPKLDRAAETETWCRACVGDEAAPALKAYYAIWEDFWKSDALHETDWYGRGMKGLYYNFDARDYVFALKREDLVRANALMKEVVAAAGRSGDAEQRVRAERLAAFHNHYRTRIVANGAFQSQPDGTFRSDEDAVRFVRSLGSIGRAAKAAVRAGERVCADKVEDQGEKFSRGACKSFNERLNKGKTGVTDLFNSLLAYMDSPGVKAALAEMAGDPDIDPERARILKGLSALDRLPNLARSGSAEADLKSWNRIPNYGIKVTAENLEKRVWRLTQTTGWCASAQIVLGLRKANNYLFSGRLTNTTKKTVTVTQIFSSQHDDLPNGEVGKGGGFETQRIYTVKPGETVQLRVFGKTSSKCAGARLYVIVSLASGESVRLEDVELKDLETEPQTKGQDR